MVNITAICSYLYFEAVLLLIKHSISDLYFPDTMRNFVRKTQSGTANVSC